MILIDPDIDPDPDPRPSRSNAKRASSNRPIDRNARVPSARTLTRFLGQAQAAVRLQGQVSVLLTTDRNIRRLNRQFRGKDKATDVLSFPSEPMIQRQENLAGDLAISVPTALRQSRGQGHTLAIELKVLILHGLLHLAGYDHEDDTGQMARRERLLRARLRLPQGLIERTIEPPQKLRAPSSRRPGVPGDRSSSLGWWGARVGNHKSQPAKSANPAAPKRSRPA